MNIENNCLTDQDLRLVTFLISLLYTLAASFVLVWLSVTRVSANNNNTNNANKYKIIADNLGVITRIDKIK